MTDRELLEAAAKAAGITGTYFSTFAGDVALLSDGEGPWNPLTNDGDALRLAVKLGIGISTRDKKFPQVRRAFLSDIAVFSVTDADPYAATRRSIVRAAAALGSQA